MYVNPANQMVRDGAESWPLLDDQIRPTSSIDRTTEPVQAMNFASDCWIRKGKSFFSSYFRWRAPKINFPSDSVGGGVSGEEIVDSEGC